MIKRKAEYETLKLVVNKKRAFFKEKYQKVLVNYELWESLKYLGMPNKNLILNFNEAKDNDILTCDTGSFSSVFENRFSN